VVGDAVKAPFVSIAEPSVGCEYTSFSFMLYLRKYTKDEIIYKIMEHQ
jgi:hypothetical protein